MVISAFMEGIFFRGKDVYTMFPIQNVFSAHPLECLYLDTTLILCQEWGLHNVAAVVHAYNPTRCRYANHKYELKCARHGPKKMY
jgi:hypothetical protein